MGSISAQQALPLLEAGDITLRGQINVSYNGVFVAEVCSSSERCLAVYKPAQGESPLWDFPEGTLYKREYLAYRVSQALGWGVVPPTVLRDGPYGAGSLQLFIDAQPGRHYFNLLAEQRPALIRMALFDCLTNNADRKGGHVLLDGDNVIWGIDHGLCFSTDRKFRTVMWELRDEPVPPQCHEALATLSENTSLRIDVSEHLSKGEVEAFYRRLTIVAKATKLPMERLADLRRPYPWPAI